MLKLVCRIQALLSLLADDFRLFCGDLGNEVNDDVLTRAFSKYASFQKAKVVRDRRTNKSKGYGFVSFKDPNDFTRAVREMNGKNLAMLLSNFSMGTAKGFEQSLRPSLEPATL